MSYLCALRELDDGGGCGALVRSSPTGAPKYHGGGARPLSNPEEPTVVAVVVAEFMYFLDNNFVGCFPLLLPATNYGGHATADAAVVVLIYDPYSSAIKRDLYGATITFTLRTRVYPPCISPTTVLLWRVTRRNATRCNARERERKSEEESEGARKRRVLCVYNRRGFNADYLRSRSCYIACARACVRYCATCTGVCVCV